jgi:hypothetical protein
MRRFTGRLNEAFPGDHPSGCGNGWAQPGVGGLIFPANDFATAATDASESAHARPEKPRSTLWSIFNDKNADAEAETQAHR